MKTSPRNGPRGFTLLELVVVLAVLAILTGMAVASFSAVEDETRRNASGDLIDRIELATVGAGIAEGNASKDIAPSFFMDTGRLPKVQGADPSLQLRELWEKPADLNSFRQVTPIPTVPGDAPDLNDLLIGCGWRGPYIRLGVGQQSLRDGYSNPLAIAFVPVGDPNPAFREWVTQIQSLGADGVPGPTTLPISLEHDIPLTPKVIFDPSSPGSLFPPLSVSISKKDGTSLGTAAKVHLIYPDSTNSNGYTVSTATLSDTTTLTHVFPSVPIGPRVIRVAYNSKKYTFHFVLPRGGLLSGLPLELP